MSKKMFKLMASFAMVMILCFCIALPAAAAEPEPGTYADPAKAAITKMLSMPVGTKTPNAKFIFDFEPKTVEGEKYDDAKKNMPKLGPIEVEFSGSELGIALTDGIKTVWVQSKNIVANVTWPNGGEYIYLLKERPGTYDAADGIKEWMNYSKAVYEIRVVVDTTADGKTYVAYIFATRKATDDEKNADEKVSTEPGNGATTYSNLTFVNSYAKTNGGGTANPEKTALDISKVVTGLGANQSKYFDFSVTVTKPKVAFENETPEYKGLIIGPDTTPNSFITFKSGESKDIKLKHGQTLVFVDLPVGSSFTVKELAAAEYKAGYTLKLDGKTMEGKSNEEVNLDLLISSQYIGEGANIAAFTNTRTGVTPTGIIVDNLPYITMIALAVLALMSYAAIRFRNYAVAMNK